MRENNIVEDSTSIQLTMLCLVILQRFYLSFSCQSIINIYQETYQLAWQDNGDDETVDCNCLTEDDRDQVLGLDPRSLNTSTNDRGASGVDTQSGSNDTERDGQANPKGCPHIGWGLRQVPTYTNTLSTPSQEIVQNWRRLKWALHKLNFWVILNKIRYSDIERL